MPLNPQRLGTMLDVCDEAAAQDGRQLDRFNAFDRWGRKLDEFCAWLLVKATCPETVRTLAQEIRSKAQEIRETAREGRLDELDDVKTHNDWRELLEALARELDGKEKTA